MAQPLLVVADNYQLATRYAREHNLGADRGNWRYISHLSDVVGRRGPGQYVHVTIGAGSVRELSERAEIVRWLDFYGFTHVAAREG